MVLEHGSKPADFQRAFEWAQKAIELGEPRGRYLSAQAMDRFLIASGHKQLFGSQFRNDDKGQACQEPTEDGFPKPLRRKYDIPPVSADACAHPLEPTAFTGNEATMVCLAPPLPSTLCIK
jgi:TPR repeat protein